MRYLAVSGLSPETSTIEISNFSILYRTTDTVLVLKDTIGQRAAISAELAKDGRNQSTNRKLYNRQRARLERKPKPNALFSPMFGRRVSVIEHRPGIYTIVTNRHVKINLALKRRYGVGSC
jgi:hypothetical protein